MERIPVSFDTHLRYHRSSLDLQYPTICTDKVKRVLPADLLELEPITDTPEGSRYSFSSAEMSEEARRLDINDPTDLPGYRQMRVVLVQTAMGYKPPSGGYRGNYATLCALAKYGHETMQFCWAFDYEIEAARKEIAALGLAKEAKWDTGKTNMLDEKLKPVQVTWWSFVNPHGVTCTALDAAVMRVVYPNPIQATDAAAWIEVCMLAFYLTMADNNRPTSDQLEPNHTPSGLPTTSKSSILPTSSSMMHSPAKSHLR